MYALATQVIVTLAGLGIVGVLIGNAIDPNSVYPAIFAGIGLILGLTIDIIYIIQYMKREERREKRSQD